jgi:predicted protein tyrosine phosphatase
MKRRVSRLAYRYVQSRLTTATRVEMCARTRRINVSSSAGSPGAAAVQSSRVQLSWVSAVVTMGGREGDTRLSAQRAGRTQRG